ncbi:MAG: MFS transporter [Leptolyngbya sp. SIO4C5]|nr:MFS transporter [Leptolyngbya sp. SIO4C5]
MTPSPADKTPAGSEKLSFPTKLAYGAGDLGPAMTANVLAFFLLFFFTNVAGLNPALAGSILLIGKVWDAINDPIVGVLSDRTQSRWGRRYPWMMFGAVPFGLLFIVQWLVPSTNAWVLFAYYVLVSVLFNIAYTAVNLPYTALTPELTSDYNERTSLNSFRFAFSLGGSILSLVLAQIIFSQMAGNPVGQYTLLASICAVLSVASLFWCVWGTWSRSYAATGRDRGEQAVDDTPFTEQLRIALRNRPFLYVIGIYLCSWLGVQVTAAIIPYFVVNWMGQPEAVFTQVALAVQGTALIMLFVWGAISNRVGKKAVYFMGMVLWIGAQAGLFFLQPGQVGLMYGLAVIAGLGVSTAYLIPWSMMPDVIDLDELQTGKRREGIFYGFMVLLQKFGLAIGLFLVGQALELSGFQESVAGQPIPVQPDSALLAIRIAIGPLPTICLIIGLILAYFYPITRTVHTEILLKLAERQQQRES